MEFVEGGFAEADAKHFKGGTLTTIANITRNM